MHSLSLSNETFGNPSKLVNVFYGSTCSPYASSNQMGTETWPPSGHNFLKDDQIYVKYVQNQGRLLQVLRCRVSVSFRVKPLRVPPCDLSQPS